MIDIGLWQFAGSILACIGVGIWLGWKWGRADKAESDRVIEEALKRPKWFDQNN